MRFLIKKLTTLVCFSHWVNGWIRTTYHAHPYEARVITTLTTLTCKITQKRDSPIKVMKKSKEKSYKILTRKSAAYRSCTDLYY